MTPLIQSFDGYVPQIGRNVFVAPGAAVVGRVELHEGVSIWYNSVLRADLELIRIGAFSCVQDVACLHVAVGAPVEVGKYVSIGHGVEVHSATIGDGVLIGNGSMLLDGSSVGAQSVVTPGTIIRRGVTIPPRSLVRGRPSQIVRELNEDELNMGRTMAMQQFELAAKYRSEMDPEPSTDPTVSKFRLSYSGALKF